MTCRGAAGRDAFERGAWRDAFEALEGVERLDQDEVECLAVAAHLVGETDASALAWEQGQRLAASRGDPERAARCAFWLGLDLLLRGEEARASGWFARVERLTEREPAGVASGLLLIPRFLAAVGTGDADDAMKLASAMRAIGEDVGDGDLFAFGLLSEGEALVLLGEVYEGMRRLDEVMVAIAEDGVSPITTGIVYCAVIAACMRNLDLRRAAEWTEALWSWCGTDTTVVPYRGQCLVHRSQVLMNRGAWDEAAAEADRARAHLDAAGHPAMGEAIYQQAELCRLRGLLGESERSYRTASRHGRPPMPGLGLLRLAQGRKQAAAASARRMLEEVSSDAERPTVLAAAVEILLAAGDVQAASSVCDELDRAAASQSAILVTALAATSRGRLLVAEGDPTDACVHLRSAAECWRVVDVPYEAARARALTAQAYELLGDFDAAELERDAARNSFEQLGARTELHRIAPGVNTSPLTMREQEVLRFVAAGLTNRAVADELVISEHTVSRHLQNIFTKIDVSSRAAATAYAFEHGIC